MLSLHNPVAPISSFALLKFFCLISNSSSEDSALDHTFLPLCLRLSAYCPVPDRDWIGKESDLTLEYYDSRRLPHVFGAYGFLNLSYQRWMAAIPAYSNHCTLRCCHIGTHLFLNRTNIAVTLYCLLSNSETSSTGGIRFHSGAYRTRTCTAFLQDDLARRSATITAMHHTPC